MSFIDLPPSPTIDRQRDQVRATARAEGIDPELLPIIDGIVKWRQLLLAPQDSPGREDLLKAYAAMGFVTNAMASSGSALTGDAKIIDPIATSMIEDVVAGRIAAPALIDSDPLDFKARFYPSLSKPQIRLLQAIISQEAHLHSLDVVPLIKQLPFPIKQSNYFGRFLASGCDTPDRAARHLQLAIPFLVRMRSLFEGLQYPVLNFLKINLVAPQDGPGPQSNAKRINPETYRNTVHLLHAAINNSWDFFGQDSADTSQRLACIPVPLFPNVDVDHIEKKRWNELAVAMYDWFFFGTRENELLNTQRLTPQREALATNHARTIAQGEAKLAELQKAVAEEPEKSARSKELQHEVKKTQQQLTRLEEALHELNDERTLVVPIITQLEEHLARNPQLRTFRSDVKKAQAAGHKIVLSFLHHPRAEKAGTLLQFFDLAFSAQQRFAQAPSAKLLKESSFLVIDETVDAICRNQSRRAEIINDRHVREFEVELAEINSSARFVVANILPRKESPRLQILIDTLSQALSVPGVQSSSELITLVKQASGRREPSANDYLDYAFERLPSMNQGDLFKVFQALHHLGIPKLSPRATELSLERFKHPKYLLDAFELYSTRYRPNKIGECPDLFQDRATFSDYLDRGIDAMGVEPELLAVQKHLQGRGIVAIVDGTNYHPELDAEIGATGEKLKKSDATRTNEVWGDYIRPSERIIRALSLRLAESEIGEGLRNSSLLGLIKPDRATQVQASLIRKFYGLDIATSPDLATINQVLADLKVYDDKPILVIDAEAITDMEQYREFINLLEKLQIKIVLRTREPLPGIPQVNIQPFLEDSLADRIMADAARLERKLGLAAPLDRSVVAFAVKQVQRSRAPQADPLNLTLQVLNGAAAHARLHPDQVITEQDVVAALAAIFHLPDGNQMRLRISAIDAFMRRAPLQILGQDKAIESIGKKVKSHILGMLDPTRPLTLLVPGPTGVGKTELMMWIARACDLPFFMVEGAEFSEEHSVARLVGSPSGYVGPDKGILYQFMEENSVALVFIDEIEKMHPSVYQALMNFFDKGTITAGNGETVTRPGFIIVGASNAGADRLSRTMSVAEVKELLSKSFVDRQGKARPELVRRFDAVVMHAIEESAFKEMIKASIGSIGGRPGFVNANLRLVGFDDAAAKLLYDRSREVCEFSEKAFAKTGTIGFMAATTVVEGGLFYDMRHVGRALDELAGESLRDIALAQYDSGSFAARGKPKLIRLVGDPTNERIVAQVVDGEEAA
jgi:MoxR-like ATPase